MSPFQSFEPAKGGISSEKIELVAVGALVPWGKNPRTHSKKQIRQIADSIKHFGFTNPIILDDQNTILAGHGRAEAAKLLRIEHIPCVRISSLTNEEKRAYVIADNKLALNAGWDEDLLTGELRDLVIADVNFDVSIIGFSLGEIDTLIDGQSEQANPIDEAPLTSVPSRCRLGDIWELGPHRLICGDSLKRDTIAALMAGESAAMIFTDPPYNVRVNGHVGGKGSVKHPEFAMASGEMTSTEFTSFLAAALTNLVEFSIDGSIHLICMDWRHMREVLDAAEGKYSELKTLIVWVKDSAGMGSFYRSRHEFIFAFKKGVAAHHNSFELGQHGRNRTNVWTYGGVTGFSRDRATNLERHPTSKPVQLIADAIRDVTPRGTIVLDLFCGGGSTLIAAHKVGRRAFVSEIDPVYCDRIIQRWESFAKDTAERVGNQRSGEHDEA